MKKLFIVLGLSIATFGVVKMCNDVPKLPEDLTCESLNKALEAMTQDEEAAALKKYGYLICEKGLEDCIADAHSVDDKEEYQTFWKNVKDTTTYSLAELEKIAGNIKCYENYLKFYNDENVIKVDTVQDYSSKNGYSCYSWVLFKGIVKKLSITDKKTMFTFAKYTDKTIVFKVVGKDGTGKPYSKLNNYTLKPRFNYTKK